MKILKFDYMHNEHGNCVEWFERQSQVDKRWKEIEAQAREENYAVHEPSVLVYEVEPTRKSIVAFLNAHTPSRDNG